VGLGGGLAFIVGEDDGIGVEGGGIAEGGVGGDGEEAIAIEEAKEAALDADAGVGGRVIDGGEDGGSWGIVTAGLDADGALADGGQDAERGGVETAGVAVEQAAGEGVAEAVEAGTGENDGVEGLGCQFCEAGGDVAAKLEDLEAGTEPKELAAAADAAGADARPGGEGVEGGGEGRYEEVRGIGAREDGGEAEGGRGDAGEILEAVDGGVDGMVEEGVLDFLCEEALQAGGTPLPRSNLRAAIAGGGDDLDLDGEIGTGAKEGLADKANLRKGEGAAP
jgi:hypothetical protein